MARQFDTIVDAKLSVFESRLALPKEKSLRPPLRADSLATGGTAVSILPPKRPGASGITSRGKPPSKSPATSTSAPPKKKEAQDKASTPTNLFRSWTEVVKGGSKKSKAAQPVPPKGNAPPKNQGPAMPTKSGNRSTALKSAAASQPKKAAAKKRKKRPPRPSAVVLTPPPDGNVSMAEVMTEVRSRIRLSDFDLERVRPRRAVTGGMILEIPGQDAAPKADRLAARISEVLAGKGVGVSRPVKMAELRLAGLDDSVTPEQVAQAIAGAGGCDAGDVRVGNMTLSPSGLFAAWVRYPQTAAEKLGERVLVG